MLGHDLAAALPELRAEAESRMTSRARVRRRSGTTQVDGFDVPGWADVHTDLPFRLGKGNGGFRTMNVGESEVQVAVREGHFPADTTGLDDGDIIEVTDGENTGAYLRIVEASWHDQATARRVPVLETEKPDGWDA
jgi:hypothetical protein